MKKSFRIAFLLLIVMSVIVNSCTKDDDSDVEPTVDPREKYTGSWLCVETNTKTSKKVTFTVSISKSSANSTEILLSNFNNIGSSATYNVKASLSGSTISIPNQNVSGDLISGSASIVSDVKMNFNYTVDDQNGSPDSYTAVFTK